MIVQRRNVGRAGGFTLLELVAALSISSILVTAIGSAVFVATRAMPQPDDAFSGTVTASRLDDQIAGELETATAVFELSPSAITFILPPRNGDRAPERVRYSWSGTPGDPLLRQYNGNQPAPVLDHVDQFALTPTIVTSTESYPGVASEDPAESLLIDEGPPTSPGDLDVSNNAWVGQYFASAAWPTGVVGWRPTRVQIQARQASPQGTTMARLSPPLATLTPDATVLEQHTILGAALTPAYGTQSINFNTIDRLSPFTGICLVLQDAAAGPASITVQANNNGGAGLLQSGDGGKTWQYAGQKSLTAQLFGKLTRAAASPQYATSKYLSALTITLRPSPSTNVAVTTTVQALNHPEVLSAFWELKFEQDPTAVDVNGDQQPDWVVHGGGGPIDPATMSSGVWQPTNQALDSTPGNDFRALTMIDLRFGGTAAGGSANFSINAARAAGTCAPIVARIAEQADGSQTITVWRKLTDTTTDALLTIGGLPSGPNDLHLIVDPGHGSVGIRVNNVEYGSFAYNAYGSADPGRSATLWASGPAEFSYVRIREALP